MGFKVRRVAGRLTTYRTKKGCRNKCKHGFKKKPRDSCECRQSLRRRLRG